MAKVSRAVIKEYFQTGDRPTQPQFSTMLDSMVNFVDDRDFVGLRDYNSSQNYIPGDCAVFNNQVIKCITATTGVFDAADWVVLTAVGSVNYAGTWDTQANVPFLQSSVGTQGFYYVVINASSNPGDNTNLNGIDDWGTGDWAIYNGTAWEKVDNSQAPVEASNVAFTPTASIAATNVQDAIEEVDTDLTLAVNTKVDRSGDTMTGDLILNANPTDAFGAATKAYVDSGDATLQAQVIGKVNRSGDTMTGDLILNADPTDVFGAATKNYVDSGDSSLQTQINGKVNKSGDAMTGDLILNADPTVALGAATKQYVDTADTSLQTQVNTKVNKAGDTMTGDLFLNADPTAALGAATKQYVDATGTSLQTQINTKVSKSGDTMTGDLILNADPSVALGAATKQYVDAGDSSLQSQVSDKVSKAGDTMTGLLILSGDPTAAFGAATRRYVDTIAGTKLSVSGGTMTGNLILNTDPSAALGAATKQYVDSAVGAVPAQVKTAAIPLTFAGAVQGFTAAAWSRFPTAATQLRVVVPPINTMFPGTTAVSAQFVVDYMTTSVTAAGNIGLYDFTTFGTVAPFGNSSQPLAATNNAWTILTTSSFPLSSARTFEIIVQRTSTSGTIFIEAVTLLLTYT